MKESRRMGDWGGEGERHVERTVGGEAEDGVA